MQLDRAKAAELGVQVADVATTLQLMVGGQKISDYNEGGEQYEVHARALPSWRTDADGLRQMAVPSDAAGRGAASTTWRASRRPRARRRSTGTAAAAR